MTELEKKIKKLPSYAALFTEDDSTIKYELKITKLLNNFWHIEYTDLNNNSILVVEHSSFQAAVDNTLSTLKEIEKWKRYQLIL